jgi:hypothetical protein
LRAILARQLIGRKGLLLGFKAFISVFFFKATGWFSIRKKAEEKPVSQALDLPIEKKQTMS